MKLILLTVLTSVISYLLGCINAAYFYAMLLKRTDIRDHGTETRVRQISCVFTD
jgi:glycerol-3-phosphate acyltransferase PlsY